MNRVEETRLVAAEELERLRSMAEREIGRPAALYRWAKPVGAALGGLALAFAAKRAVRHLGRRARRGDAAD